MEKLSRKVAIQNRAQNQGRRCIWRLSALCLCGLQSSIEVDAGLPPVKARSNVRVGAERNGRLGNEAPRLNLYRDDTERKPMFWR